MSEEKAAYEFQAERDHAVRELTRRLRPVTALRDPEAAAADFIDWLLTERWRPPLRPAPAWKQLHDQPAADSKRIAAVNELREKWRHPRPGEES